MPSTYSLPGSTLVTHFPEAPPRPWGNPPLFETMGGCGREACVPLGFEIRWPASPSRIPFHYPAPACLWVRERSRADILVCQ